LTHGVFSILTWIVCVVSARKGGALVNVFTDGSVLLSHGGVEMGQGLHTKMVQVKQFSKTTYSGFRRKVDIINFFSVDMLLGFQYTVQCEIEFSGRRLIYC